MEDGERKKRDWRGGGSVRGDCHQISCGGYIRHNAGMKRGKSAEKKTGKKLRDWADIQRRAIRFREERDWKQFHNPKDVALSMVLEAGEVMEHFQWKNAKEMEEHVRTHKGEIGDELADVLYYIAVMSKDMGIDIFDAFEKKMKKNEAKYPIAKAKGKHTKYTNL